MRYLLSRRAITARNLEDFNVQHVDLGVELTHEDAVATLTNSILLEAKWLEAEHEMSGGHWRTVRADRLASVAALATNLTDGVYRSVDCDGVRYGWLRQN